ncbi:ribosome biogenesis GTPase [Grosmannia clavigera kw1407]|uniref:Ribosome biogenesis GTPase n=1 Tax=Grosmannia clavigera (strain kw1407 / UAMH 11150) TaxID=655863 RepID=F0XRB3_GROCL|nr:ribosome biogenesis GTPase [Grosmannia clavigera kw1407]EFW99887.1 ribosome biogenesis GTPase [Grosmannia clavigera kw1407]
MVLPKSKTSVGLGNTLMKDRFGKGKGADRRKGASITRTDHVTGEQYVTTARREAGWVKMRSVTEQGALEEFLATAQLAGTDFTAQKMNNVKIIHTDQKNPYLLTAAEERTALKKHKENRDRLTVPRRPKWDASTTPGELDLMERESFLVWRRGLAELQENQDLLMTPFERNLEVWRQLWRVIERSDLVVQIVDARSPLLFRSEDLEDYVKEIDPRKENLLLINKADMMTEEQRLAWATYLKKANVSYKFFSAYLAKELNEQREFESSDEEGSEDESEDETERVAGGAAIAPKEEATKGEVTDVSNDANEDEPDTHILTVEELEELFLSFQPKDDSNSDRRLQVGLVGYPNVGKSSTINALIGAKKVSVSSTPGKTKHFQTIHLSEKVILCDCPGLVFANFATTKADLVCNGVLPIDQLREFTGPAALVAHRIPLPFLEAVYGMHIRLRPLEEGGTGMPTAEELLMAYARARGFTKAGQGQPDESRAARYILKDYVNGKLLYCAPPPGDYDPVEFNRGLYDVAHLPEKRRVALGAAKATGAMQGMSLAEDEANSGSEDDGETEVASDMIALPVGPKTQKLDKEFFKPQRGTAGHMDMPFSHKYSEQGQAAGKQLSGRKARLMVALENGLDPSEVRALSGKKHFKAGKKAKGKKKIGVGLEEEVRGGGHAQV